MEKINIAELLKDCPQGMELDCTIFGTKVIYQKIYKTASYPIVVQTEHGFEFRLTQYGQIHNIVGAECVIFPKDKTTWEGFHRPFKDGDIVAVTMKPEGIWIGIFKQHNETSFESHCCLNTIGEFNSKGLKNHSFIGLRFATEEEKAKLFQTVKDNGYRWNKETKTLEKLPKFKVGDRIILKDNPHNISSIRIKAVTKSQYILENESFLYIDGADEKYVLEDRFDITTLKPFDKVLVRNTITEYWRISLFGAIVHNDRRYFMCLANSGFYQCIPYEGNQHLLGTNNDCDNFFKVWEE